MNWEAIGAIGEILGAVAVLGTLYYLAAQIKKSNEYARTQISIDIQDSGNSLFDILMRDREFVATYHRAMKNQDLDEIETEQFTMLIIKLMSVVESAELAYKSELLWSGEYEMDFIIGNPYMHSLLDTKVGSVWFKEKSQNFFSKEFLENIANFRNKINLNSAV